MSVGGADLDSCRDEEVNEDRFDLSLSGLEVVSSQKHLLLLGQLHHTGNKRVLRRPIDISALWGRKRKEAFSY